MKRIFDFSFNVNSMPYIFSCVESEVPRILYSILLESKYSMVSNVSVNCRRYGFAPVNKLIW